MKVLVCGGRGFSDTVWLYATLDKLYTMNNFTHLIHGAARGADTLAGQWARQRGVQEVVCPANWDVHHRNAGVIRNAYMAKLLGPSDMVVVFPGGTGTHDMTKRAQEAGIPVMRV